MGPPGAVDREFVYIDFVFFPFVLLLPSLFLLLSCCFFLLSSCFFRVACSFSLPASFVLFLPSLLLLLLCCSDFRAERHTRAEHGCGGSARVRSTSSRGRRRTWVPRQRHQDGVGQYPLGGGSRAASGHRASRRVEGDGGAAAVGEARKLGRRDSAILAPSWPHVGPCWTHLDSFLDYLCSNMAPTCANRAPTCAKPAPRCAHLAPRCTNQAPRCANPAPGCTNPAPRCADLAPTCADLAPTCAKLAPSWPISAPSWAILGPICLLPALWYFEVAKVL